MYYFLHKYDYKRCWDCNMLCKYGATRMEVDIDGSFAYAETQNDMKDSGKLLIL